MQMVTRVARIQHAVQKKTQFSHQSREEGVHQKACICCSFEKILGSWNSEERPRFRALQPPDIPRAKKCDDIKRHLFWKKNKENKQDYELNPTHINFSSEYHVNLKVSHNKQKSGSENRATSNGQSHCLVEVPYLKTLKLAHQ